MDYEKYAQFKCLLDIEQFDNKLVNQFINKIDKKIKTFQDVEFLQIETFFKECDEQLLPLINKLKNHIFQKIDSIIEKELISTLFQKTYNLIIYDIFMKIEKKNYTKNDEKNLKLKELKKKGMLVLDINKSMTNNLIDTYKTLYEESMKKEASESKTRVQRTINKNNPMGKLLLKYIKNLKIENLISDYLQTNVKFANAIIEYSHDSQDWFQNACQETQYMHFDGSKYTIKVLWYLTKVNSNKYGATKFIPTSHTWKKSFFKFNFSNALDQILCNRFNSVLENNDYLKHLKDPKMNEVFKSLPEALRLTTHFGDMIQDKKIAKELVSKEVMYLSNLDKILIFDGGNGIHRGAIVTEGERLALQISFTPTNLHVLQQISNSKPEINNLIYKYEMKLLEKIHKLDNNLEIVLYGFGTSGQAIYQRFKEKKNFTAIIDNYTALKTIDNIQIFKQNEFKFKFNQIIIISIFQKEVVNEILNSFKDISDNIKIISI